MCHGFSHFSGFLHNLILANLATSSIMVDSMLRLFDNLATKILVLRHEKAIMINYSVTTALIGNPR